ncbi:hypothetical protein T484DRAFT_1799458 [Baffinella frigidus]|nr:hypothetical protein T484DRAFT_1799458 [Cryptophyta sp. CCMP2293]
MAASMARPAASLLLLMATSATAFAPSLPTSRPAVLGRSAAASLLLSAPRRAVADGAVGAKMAGNEGGDVSRRGAMGVLFGLGLTFAGAGSVEA